MEVSIFFLYHVEVGNVEKKYLTIDIGGTTIKYCVIDKNTQNIKINEADSKRSEDEFFDCMDDVIQPHLSEIDGIAISFPGIVNVEEGIVHGGDNYVWIRDLPLKSILEKIYSKTVWIENDGKCAALAELWKGNLSDVENGVTIGLGTGIAGGIILNGKLHRGISGSAGEFSSFLVNLEKPINDDRFYQIANYKSLTNRYSKENPITGKEFFKHYHNGDEAAIKALKDYAKTIAAGIINIQVVLDVEKFCIGGGISAQDVLINEIKHTVHDFFTKKPTNALREPAIEKCHFENAAGCVGALYNFLNMQKIL